MYTSYVINARKIKSNANVLNVIDTNETFLSKRSKLMEEVIWTMTNVEKYFIYINISAKHFTIY